MTRQPRALVVHESMFGSTAAVAAAVADGLRDEGYDVVVADVATTSATALPVPLAELDLLVLGGPTHAFSMTRASTRQDAVRQGADPGRAEVGLREWIAALPRSADPLPPVAVFDTRAAKARRLPAAARKTARLLRAHGARAVVPPEGFLVEDVQGPVVDGELPRASRWGRAVGAAARAAAPAEGPADLGT
ncbi:hypothetical protein [Nocardioides sp. TF02-7]|uniref:hypothetical protein n=1 Tax=Nocardioides sp. TF02-7 TaxID=2917724 RepID=UPI001F05275B|nr:hypothetical protein [Nocardioides sp. TF02-7]UMG91892.1 hypothetical protein MF408_17970 [Nocardioides sp. TF02-7]